MFVNLSVEMTVAYRKAMLRYAEGNVCKLGAQAPDKQLSSAQT